MIKRIVANGKFKDDMFIFEAVMEAKESFLEHFGRSANRIELSIHSLEDIRMHHIFQSDATMAAVERVLGLTVVVDESLSSTDFNLVFEKVY